MYKGEILGEIPATSIEGEPVVEVAGETVSLEQITGGIRVDAETGQIHEPTDPNPAKTEWDEDQVRITLAERGARIARGMRRFNSKTERRVSRANIGTSAVAGSVSTKAPTMPKRLSAKERREADRVLRWHSRAFKNNRDANRAY